MTDNGVYCVVRQARCVCVLLLDSYPRNEAIAELHQLTVQLGYPHPRWGSRWRYMVPPWYWTSDALSR